LRQKRAFARDDGFVNLREVSTVFDETRPTARQRAKRPASPSEAARSALLTSRQCPAAIRGGRWARADNRGRAPCLRAHVGLLNELFPDPELAHKVNWRMEQSLAEELQNPDAAPAVKAVDKPKVR
jgi:hypothetical protein